MSNIINLHHVFTKTTAFAEKSIQDDGYKFNCSLKYDQERIIYLHSEGFFKVFIVAFTVY